MELLKLVLGPSSCHSSCFNALPHPSPKVSADGSLACPRDPNFYWEFFFIILPCLATGIFVRAALIIVLPRSILCAYVFRIYVFR